MFITVNPTSSAAISSCFSCWFCLFERFIAYSAALIDVSEPSIATSILKFYLFSFLFQGGLMLACYIYKFKLTIPDAMAFTKETRGRKKTFEYWFYLVKDSIQAFFTLPLCPCL